MFCYREIAENLYWVGGNDRRIRGVEVQQPGACQHRTAAQHHAGDHVDHQNLGGGEGGLINEDLPDEVYAKDEKK